MKLRLVRRSRRSLLVSVVAAVLLLAGGGMVLAAYFGGGGPSTSDQAGSINLSKGLVGWWRLNGNVNDSTPYADNGTDYGATSTSGRQGNTNGAYSFNGSSNYISIPASNALNNSTYTISAWIYMPSIAVNATIVGSASSGGPYVRVANGGLQASNNCNNGSVWAGAWINLVYTYDNSTGQTEFYVNGNGVGCASSPTTFTWSNYEIGVRQNSLDYFNGDISDVRIYNRVLSSAEASALYKGYDSQVSSARGENGLVSWWKLQGNAKDSSPYGNNGTVNGATLTTDRKGAVNGAYSFNGTSSYISTALPTAQTANVTISAWFQTADYTQDRQIIAYDGNGAANGYGVALNQENMHSGQVMVLYGSVIWYATGVYVTDTAWHHIVLVVQSTDAPQVYLDGALIYTGAAHTPVAPAGSFGIGTDFSGVSTPFFDGSISDVRVYDRSLSASDVLGLYKQYDAQIELGGSGASGSVSLGKGLVGYWPFNGNAKDATPYAHDGTVNGPTLAPDREGRQNSSYLFGAYKSINTNYNYPMQNLSVSGWVYPTNSTSGVQPVASNTRDCCSAGQYTGGFQLSLANGTELEGYIWNTTSFASATATNVVPLNQWSLVAETYDGNTIRIYVNGSLVGSTAFSGTQAAPAYNVLIGDMGGYSGRGYNFVGNIDDVRLYNRVLSAAEIMALYNEYQ